jgi:hypothetical protein
VRLINIGYAPITANSARQKCRDVPLPETGRPALDQGEAVGQQRFFVLLLEATNQPKRADT